MDKKPAILKREHDEDEESDLQTSQNAAQSSSSSAITVTHRRPPTANVAMSIASTSSFGMNRQRPTIPQLTQCPPIFDAVPPRPKKLILPPPPATVKQFGIAPGRTSWEHPPHTIHGKTVAGPDDGLRPVTIRKTVDGKTSVVYKDDAGWGGLRKSLGGRVFYKSTPAALKVITVNEQGVPTKVTHVQPYDRGELLID